MNRATGDPDPTASAVSTASTASGDPAVTVVLPAYREAENLPQVIPAVSRCLEEAGMSHEILVVDDDSRDGTEPIIASLAERSPVRLIIRRGERGLSSAVVRGFAEARGRVLACMDADGSHPPEKLAELIRPILDGRAEFTLGSRYVPGGSTDAEWTHYRRLNSRLATLLARPLTSIRDPMSGFFALSREGYHRAGRFRPRGYKIGLELLVRSGARRCLEVPIHFRDRRLGRSKLSLRVQMVYLWQLVMLTGHRLFRRQRR